MSGRIDGFGIRDLLGDQGFDYLGNKTDVIIIHRMEVLLKIPFCEWSNRFCTDENEAPFIDVRTKPHAGSVRFPSCTMEAKENRVAFIRGIVFGASNNEPPTETIMFDLNLIGSCNK